MGEASPTELYLNCTVGHTETDLCNGVNVWGEYHLWVGYRKGFNLSGLSEPEILIGDNRRIPMP